MSRKWLLVVTVIGVFFTLGAAQSSKWYDASRFDVDAVVQSDGSLLVTETVVFNFHGDPFTYVFRELPTDHTDGITGLAATLDGRPLPLGDQPGQVEISGRNPVRVTWHFEPTSDTSRTFVLTYTMLGLVRQEGERDAVIWQPLPDSYEYGIGSSTVHVHYPSRAALIGQPGLMMGNAGINATPGLVTFTQQNLAPNTPLVIDLRFPGGSLVSNPPAWQGQRAARQATAPYWIAASLTLLFVGIAAIVTLSANHRQPTPRADALLYEPPSPLPPALVNVIVNLGAKPTWDAALAAIFQLARRGVLTIEEESQRKWYRSRDFVINLVQEPTDLLPHEQQLLALIFMDRKGLQRSVMLSDLSQRVSSRRWEVFSDTLYGEVEAAGFLEASRQQARRRWLATGFILILVGLVLVVPAILLLYDNYGLWPLLFAGSVVIVGFVALIIVGTIYPLSRQGLALAAQWRGFGDYLKRVVRDKAGPTRGDIFDHYLPYAASFGILASWARYFQKKGWTKLPPWFHALTTVPNDGMAAFVAMAAASSASGGSAAGAAGGAAAAGAAGGGASGAG